MGLDNTVYSIFGLMLTVNQSASQPASKPASRSAIQTASHMALKGQTSFVSVFALQLYIDYQWVL